jgi:hypothetical protein
MEQDIINQEPVAAPQETEVADTTPDLSEVEVVSNGNVVDLSDEENDTNQEETTAESTSEQESEISTPQKEYAEAKESMNKTAEELSNKGVDYSKLEEEYNENGELSEESYKALKKAGYDREIVDAVIAGWQAKADAFYDAVVASAGGEQEYSRLTKFVESQGQQAVEAFNNIAMSGDINTITSYLAGVKAQMVAKYGSNNPTLTGRGVAKAVSGFANQAEMIKAMSDKRYGRDEKYTKEVERRVAASDNIFG